MLQLANAYEYFPGLLPYTDSGQRRTKATFSIRNNFEAAELSRHAEENLSPAEWIVTQSCPTVKRQVPNKVSEKAHWLVMGESVLLSSGTCELQHASRL